MARPGPPVKPLQPARPARQPQSARIARREQLNADTFRLTLQPRDPAPFREAAPGQYAMVWVPHAAGRPCERGASDMVPFSIAGVNGDEVTLLVRAVGPTTRELSAYGEGESVGISSPLGNGFTLPPRGPLLGVAGGTGVAPLLFLRQRLASRRAGASILFGAATGSGLLGLHDRPGFTCATEDGSAGHRGMVTDLLPGAWDAGREGRAFGGLACCGPERMMRVVLDFAIRRGVDAQFSLERHLYCASGVCGFCEAGGLRACVEGPVFTARRLAGVTGFGERRRDASGVWITL